MSDHRRRRERVFARLDLTFTALSKRSRQAARCIERCAERADSHGTFDCRSAVSAPFGRDCAVLAPSAFSAAAQGREHCTPFSASSIADATALSAPVVTNIQHRACI
jgi:hypothetical protein